ncbi:zinc finger protein [Fusarium circinatum]|uniref:Zinc finger protein n=1 Tax=Fusarium circinatum TaxID=48490 RepID=A0A8H5X3H4_FUSCI|nr:zinc finger protein [Fusarium circinatum]
MNRQLFDSAIEFDSSWVIDLPKTLEELKAENSTYSLIVNDNIGGFTAKDERMLSRHYQRRSWYGRGKYRLYKQVGKQTLGIRARRRDETARDIIKPSSSLKEEVRNDAEKQATSTKNGRLYDRRLARVTPVEWIKDPYLVCIILSLAQIQWRSDTTRQPHLYLTDYNDSLPPLGGRPFTGPELAHHNTQEMIKKQIENIEKNRHAAFAELCKIVPNKDDQQAEITPDSQLPESNIYTEPQMPSIGATQSWPNNISESSRSTHLFLRDDEDSETRCGIPEGSNATPMRGGYRGILPKHKQCIPLCQTFRQNLPRIKLGKQFPLRLEIIFSVFHPGHKLIGTNHQALPDCQQTRLTTSPRMSMIGTKEILPFYSRFLY